MPTRCICIIAFIRISFFSMLNNVLYLYHILFIPSSIHGHLAASTFQLFEQGYCEHAYPSISSCPLYFISLGCVPREGIAESNGYSVVNFLRFHHTVFTTAAPSTFPPSGHKDLHFLHILTNAHYFLSLFLKNNMHPRNFLVVQCLGLYTLTPGSTGSIPVREPGSHKPHSARYK